MAAPASKPDILNFWPFFQTFIAENKVSLTLHACHEEICDTYEAAVLGQLPDIEYILVNMPRRIGKTKILEALASWTIGEFDDAQMIYGAYSETLVIRTIAYIRRTLQQPWYQQLYGNKIYSSRADLVTTVAGGSIYGAGTGATITGFGAGLKEPAGGFITLDDPAKPDEALSKVSSAAVIQNFETTWKGCRNSDKTCPIIINAQRLGENDLPGYVKSTYPNRTLHLKFPCMVNGVSLYPETWSSSTLLDLEKTRMGRYVLASQFQQEPVALGGNLIPVAKFIRYDQNQSLKWDQKIVTVDTGLRAKEVNDNSVLQCWGRLKNHAYLIDEVMGKWESPELLEMALLFYKKHHLPESSIRRFTIEAKAAGIGLAQQMRRLGIPVEEIERSKDKVTRVQEVLPYIETGMVHIPLAGSNPWVAGFETELAGFKADGTADHDDQVDAMADGIWLLLGRALSIFDVLGGSKR